MSSRTCTATPSYTLLEPQRRRSGERRRYRGQVGGLSSPAGLHPAPWLSRLRRAIRDELFVLHFQPIVALRDGELSHHEVLLRLADRPDGTLVEPRGFLAAAERHGLIQQIDRMVLSKAAALMAPGAAGAEARLAVNLSALSVTEAGMLAHVQRELGRNRVDPGRLIIEVTETAAISDMGRAARFCEGVRALGCQVALDDFGAGHGSFHYLKRLPFDHLKIDGEFIRSLTASRSDQLVVSALVAMARGMGKQTIAEFVGDEPTLRLVRRLGVDYAQGFQVGRPAGWPDVARPLG